MPARLSWVSFNSKPSGSIKCNWVCVAAHSLATLPVFGAISGSTRTTCISLFAIEHLPQDQATRGSAHSGDPTIFPGQQIAHCLGRELAEANLNQRSNNSTAHFVQEAVTFDDKSQ